MRRTCADTICAANPNTSSCSAIASSRWIGRLPVIQCSTILATSISVTPGRRGAVVNRKWLKEVVRPVDGRTAAPEYNENAKR